MIINDLDHDRPLAVDRGNLLSPTIRTYSGLYVDPFNMKPADVELTDIAHSLSLQCRFAGHVSTFYSVAQHSLNVGHMVLRMTGNKHWAALGLLHDADEAYLPDMVRPIKVQPEMKAYLDAGVAAQQVIWDKLLPVMIDREWIMDEIVKPADNEIVPWEMAMYRDQVLEPQNMSDVACRFMNAYEDWSK